jgi:GNAT superfamily N-acetyltransferase
LVVRQPVKLVGPSLRREHECEAILRTLPEWFGIEDALLMYARDTGTLPTFALEESSQLVAFLSLREHFSESWEINCVAVTATHRNKGLGSRMLSHAEEWLSGRGARYLQVKTLAPGASDPSYEQSRHFYLARGFTPVEVFPKLWSPSNPALLLIKQLGAA